MTNIDPRVQQFNADEEIDRLKKENDFLESQLAEVVRAAEPFMKITKSLTEIYRGECALSPQPPDPIVTLEFYFLTMYPTLKDFQSLAGIITFIKKNGDKP